MNKQKIYIAVIVICILATGGILYFGMGMGGGGGGAAISPSVTPTPAPSASSGVARGDIPQVDVPVSFSTPGVFPLNTSVNMEVFSSSRFTSLTDFTPLTVNPTEIGRENPFQDY